MRLVVAVHGREMKTALFLALTGIEAVDIVATASSTAELVSYWHAFRPDVAIVESRLPGRALGEVLVEIDDSMFAGQIFLIEGPDTAGIALDHITVRLFQDIDQMVSAIPETNADHRAN